MLPSVTSHSPTLFKSSGVSQGDVFHHRCAHSSFWTSCVQSHNLGFPHFSQRQTEQQQQKYSPKQWCHLAWSRSGLFQHQAIRDYLRASVPLSTNERMDTNSKDHRAFHLKLNQQSTVPLRLCCFANPYNTHQGSMTVGDKGKDAYS